MPGLSFLSKKSWHTSNISNQEKVWIAEQKAAAEEAKLKELSQQIKLEREQEELQKITGKKSTSGVGDRGVDWMYEGHKKGEDDDDGERQRAAEEAANEAYLLGKEYVPEGQTKQSGDFAVASSMTGALEKASTVGASIGVSEGGWKREEKEEKGDGDVLRIQDDNDANNHIHGPAESAVNEWNQNFHLRHEDPMFSVMQRKQAKDKDVEKKKKLMEKAGLVVKERTKPTADEYEKIQHDEREEKRRERRRRKDAKKSKKKRKHKHHHRRGSSHKKPSRRRERSRSPSDDDDYSSSSYYSASSYSSSGHDSRYGRHHGRTDDNKKSSSRRYHNDSHHSSDKRGDRHDDHYHHRRKRSQSRERRRSSPGRYRHDDYDRYERPHKNGSNGERRRRERSRSYEREESRGHRRSRGDDVDSMDKARYSDRNDTTKEATPPTAAATEGKPYPKKEGYGLIGTSISNKDSTSTKTSIGKSDYLGPDQKLLAAKRQEIERERQSRFDQGRKRRRGEEDEGGGRSYEERQRAVEEMERNARDRVERWSK